MSFNASFGQDLIEDSNEMLSGEEVESFNNDKNELIDERNNISFEGSDNLNVNINNKSNDAVPENNDIFNSIPMEIETEENERVFFYQKEYLIEHLIFI